MNCPNCNTLCGVHDRFCYCCGTPLYENVIPPRPRQGTRWIPVLLLLFMSVAGIALFFATANQEVPIEAETGADCFSIKEGVLYFNESYYFGSSELTVPGKVNGQIVYALSEDCFAFCDGLTTVVLPDTLVSIGDGAFRGCTSLRGLSIPDSVSFIGEDAFSGCSALEAISIPGSLRTIRSGAFDNCSYLGFIYYDGPYDSWVALYDEFINPYVGVFCQDGSFYQGGDLYE